MIHVVTVEDLKWEETLGLVSKKAQQKKTMCPISNTNWLLYHYQIQKEDLWYEARVLAQIRFVEHIEYFRWRPNNIVKPQVGP